MKPLGLEISDYRINPDFSWKAGWRTWTDDPLMAPDGLVLVIIRRQARSRTYGQPWNT